MSLPEPPIPDVTVISLTSPTANTSYQWSKDGDCTTKSQGESYPCGSSNLPSRTHSPGEVADEAEEALNYVSEQCTSSRLSQSSNPETTITSLHSLTTKVTIARKASQTWKGFSLKKQLNRVKKNPLLPNREKTPTSGSSSNMSPTDEQNISEFRRDSDAPDDNNSITNNCVSRGFSDKCVEGSTRTADDSIGADCDEEFSKVGKPNRPVDLPLFESDGRSVRASRQHPSGYKKKSSSESRACSERDGTGKHDTRLLSVPNVKHQKQDQSSLRDLRRKQQTTVNQPSFGNLLIRHFSKCR